MNSQTAKHFNALRARTENPIALKIRDNGPALYIDGGSEAERESVYELIETLRAQVHDAAVAQEIREAAAQDRKALPNTGGGGGMGSLIGFPQYNGGNKGAAGKALAMIQAAIDERIQSINQQADDAYEAYRQACIQGVAVPPADSNE